MNCLPIVGRELRVAARKRSTFWLRVAAALTALLIGGGCMVLSLLPGSRSFQMGSALFNVLTWLCLAAGLSAGLFFTSDCLSEEKREGTLGLLFLTDLRGYDVALGKLLATSLRGFYALLAVLPILSITLCMGGVTGAQYWKNALALVNALFFSLAAGMAVSAVSRDSQKAMMGTLLVLLLLALGGPVVDGTIAGMKGHSFEPYWSLLSPAYVLAAASAWGGSSYWNALVTTHLLGWGMLALASVLVPHTWQERKKTGAGRSQGWSYAWRYGGARRRLRLRRRLIGRQPVAWLACRERWQSLGLWTIALLAVGGFVAALLSALPQETWIVWSYIGDLFTLILYLWAASQACRFFVEARRSGLLELVLATPLNEKQIVAGQWQALLRMFGLPVLLLLGVQVAGSTLSQVGFQRIVTQASTVTSSVVTNRSGKVTSRTVIAGSTVTVSGNAATNTVTAPVGFQPVSPAAQTVMAVTTAVVTAVSMAANLVALCWFGMWMGLTSRSANLATLKTILFVQVIPWFVMAFGAGIIMALLMAGVMARAGLGGRSAPFASFLWWPLLSAVLTAALAMAKDIGFIVWSRRKLRSSVREEAAHSLGQPRFAAPQPVPEAVSPPPLIAAQQ
jgi:ABC-type transport system involved in multi-copper enzyme maturation permease subunit